MRIVAVSVVLALLAGGVVLVTSCEQPVEKKPAPLPPQPEGWDADIKIREAVDLDPAPDVVAVELEARLATLEIEPGVLTEVWSYDGQVPGPTIRAKRGDKVIVTFRNSLPDPTTIHWHGLRVDASMDGTEAMQEPVLPGETFVYELELKDEGTYWYHPHIDSSAQLGYGLYGAFIVEDPDEPRLGDELVLVVSDMGLDADGQLLPGDHQGWFGDFFGRAGGVHLVNGKVAPSILARAGVPQRWRIVNASRAHYDRILMPGHGFTQVGVDGGLLERPIADAQAVLPPGARAEVVFVPADTSRNTTIAVENAGVDRFHVGADPPRNHLFDVKVTDDPPATAPSIPTHLRDIDEVDVTGAREQTVTLETVLAEDGNTYFGINGVLDHGHDADPFMATVNTTEVWTLKNTTTMDHPFHLHGFFFQVLDVDGEPPPFRGWLDTVNLEPQQTVRIAIPFDDRAGMWMFHCHILDHADTGMMRMLMLMEEMH